MSIQTILGSGGAIGTELAEALLQYNDTIRLVSRKPVKTNRGDEILSADLTQREEVFRAVKGSAIVYVTIGFPYNLKIWQSLWPVFMRNVLDACIEYRSRLVFFDNVYALDAACLSNITEDTPVNPTSKKGKVRATVDAMIEDAVARKQLDAIIARSPDFFSHIKANSVMMTLVYDNLIKGKKANWMCDLTKIHSMGYAPDLAKGTAMLGNAGDTYNRIWNLPVSSERLNGLQWIELFAKEIGSPASCRVLSNRMLKVLGIFIPVLREIPEMNYQFDRDYFFNSARFNKHFGFTPTPAEEAVRQVVLRLRNLPERNPKT